MMDTNEFWTTVLNAIPVREKSSTQLPNNAEHVLKDPRTMLPTNLAIVSANHQEKSTQQLKSVNAVEESFT